MLNDNAKTYYSGMVGLASAELGWLSAKVVLPLQTTQTLVTGVCFLFAWCFFWFVDEVGKVNRAKYLSRRLENGSGEMRLSLGQRFEIGRPGFTKFLKAVAMFVACLVLAGAIVASAGQRIVH
jgi:hypothetical protein